MAERGNKGRTPARGRGIVSMRREITGRRIIELLRANGTPMPYNARVYVRVPRGGDYSGMELDIDKEIPITVSTKPYDRKDRR